MIPHQFCGALSDTRSLGSLVQDTSIAIAIVTIGVVIGVVIVLVTIGALALWRSRSRDRAEIVDALGRFVERLTGFFRARKPVRPRASLNRRMAR